MKTLLRIDASIRLKGSCTRTLTDYFQTRWQEANPKGTVIRRCLTGTPIPHLSKDLVEAFRQTPGRSERSVLSDNLITELKRANHMVIGSPLYNLTLPSTLKAYFDHVVRSGETFEVRQGAYRGLLNGKSATVITARGGISSPEYEDDFQTAYLRAILAFMGIGPVDVIALEGLALDEQTREKALWHAKQKVDQLAICTLQVEPRQVNQESRYAG